MFKSVDAEGHVVYSDHADPDRQSSVVHLEDAPALPEVMHFCWTNCFTLQLAGGLYRRADGSDETWTVERFTSASFVLHRHDPPASWNGFSRDVAYEGQVSGERLLNVTVGGKPVDDIQMAWGAALPSLPGSNEERDRGTSPPSTADAASPGEADIRTAEVPPPLQDDVPPPSPDDASLWAPAYWAWGGGGYYWVPGAWVQPPRPGMLWTPAYWSFAGAVYVFHPGYWAPHVGFYGGINYGFGYPGIGFTGGRWVGNAFVRTASPAGGAGARRVSYNGGPGGINALPTPQERAVASEPHLPMTPLQHQSLHQAAGMPTLAARSAAPAPTVARSVAANTHRAAARIPAAQDSVSPVQPAAPPVARPAAPKAGSAKSTSPAHPTR